MHIVNSNIKKAKTIPSEFYYSKTKFEQLKSNLFTNHWQFICDKNQVKNHGDAMPYELIESFIEDPLILMFINDGLVLWSIVTLTPFKTHGLI